MKFTFLTSALLSSILILTGCVSTPNLNHQTQIPKEIKANLSSDKAIIAYFSRSADTSYSNEDADIDSSYSALPVPNGYYRILLGRNAQGHFLVQDFYLSTHTPQSSPAWVLEPYQLFSFSGSDVDGPVTLYLENGKIVAKFINKNGVAIESEEFYPNGQIGAKYVLVDGNKAKNQLWYASGKKAAEYIIDSDNTIISSQQWLEDGTPSDDFEQIIENVYALLDPEF